MTPTNAIKALRGLGNKPHALTGAEREAARLGAEAVEFVEWLEANHWSDYIKVRAEWEERIGKK